MDDAAGAAMLGRCAELEKLCTRRGQEEAAQMWRDRRQVTRGWNALPDDIKPGPVG